MQGVCRMVERRERCLVERLSPCLPPALIGRLVGNYRAIWRWELEERYEDTADKGRVRTELGSCLNRGQGLDWHTSAMPYICTTG